MCARGGRDFLIDDLLIEPKTYSNSIYDIDQKTNKQIPRKKKTLTN